MNIHERVVKELYYDMAARLATSSDNHGKVSVLSHGVSNGFESQGDGGNWLLGVHRNHQQDIMSKWV